MTRWHFVLSGTDLEFGRKIEDTRPTVLRVGKRRRINNQGGQCVPLLDEIPSREIVSIIEDRTGERIGSRAQRKSGDTKNDFLTARADIQVVESPTDQHSAGIAQYSHPEMTSRKRFF